MNKRYPVPHSFRAKSQRGSAAIELAVLIPIFLVLMTFPVFYARCFWHYTVAQKAAQDAVRYLSKVSRPEMMSKTLATGAAAMAIDIAQREMAELAPGSEIATPEIYCDNRICGVTAGKVPTTVRVFITLSMYDTFFGVVDTGRYGLTINAEARMAYVGS